MPVRMGWRLVAPLVLSFVAATAHAQSGGGFDLSWNALQPGGGIASQGGGFDVSGGLGGVPWSELQGGGFDLRGGFWRGLAGLVAVDPPGFVPSRFALLPAAPNPFTRSVALGFDLPDPRRVRADVFDISGHRVRALVDATLAPGRHHLSWDGSTDSGSRAGAGIYFLQLNAGAEQASARIALIH